MLSLSLVLVGYKVVPEDDSRCLSPPGCCLGEQKSFKPTFGALTFKLRRPKTPITVP